MAEAVLEAALTAGAFATSYLGFALLALRQKPHHAAVSASSARTPLPRAFLRRCLALGSVALALGFTFSLLAQGPSFGSISWVLSSSAAALGVMFTLAYRPRWLRPLHRAFAGQEALHRSPQSSGRAPSTR
jgi:hypothetical protein